MGAWLAGFASNGNPLFRGKKWKHSGLVDGRCILVKRGELTFDTQAVLMDDYAFTARNLLKYGRVLINNWVLPEADRYTPGGCGTKEERMTAKIAEAKYLTEAYPGIIQYAEKKDWPTGAHVRIMFRGRDPDAADTGPKYINLFDNI